MNDYLANPPWWAVLILGIVLAKRWDLIEKYIGIAAIFLMNHTRGKVRGFWRHRRLARKIREKIIRTDQLEITRLLVRSYTYLVLFILLMLAFLFSLSAASFAADELHSHLMFQSIAIALPSFIFEILWLRTSAKVTKYITLNRKIKKTSRNFSKAFQPASSKATQAEIEAQILKAALTRVGHRDKSINPEQHKNTYDYYYHHEIKYFDDDKKSGYIVIYYSATKGTSLHFKIIDAETPSSICLAMDIGTTYVSQADPLI